MGALIDTRVSAFLVSLGMALAGLLPVTRLIGLGVASTGLLLVASLFGLGVYITVGTMLSSMSGASLSFLLLWIASAEVATSFTGIDAFDFDTISFPSASSTLFVFTTD